MTRAITPAAASAATAEVVARSVAIALDFPAGMVRLNGSVASITIAGEEFLGIGGLGSISAVEESVLPRLPCGARF